MGQAHPWRNHDLIAPLTAIAHKSSTSSATSRSIRRRTVPASSASSSKTTTTLSSLSMQTLTLKLARFRQGSHLCTSSLSTIKHRTNISRGISTIRHTRPPMTPETPPMLECLSTSMGHRRLTTQEACMPIWVLTTGTRRTVANSSRSNSNTRKISEMAARVTAMRGMKRRSSQSHATRGTSTWLIAVRTLPSAVAIRQ